MIAYGFGLALPDVEMRPYPEYKLMLFTVMNMALLQIGSDGFKCLTPEEEVEALEQQIRDYMDRGFFRG